jgi:hypothetical protein
VDCQFKGLLRRSLATALDAADSLSARVAEWAGNSLPMLLRVYAKCLADTEQNARARSRKRSRRPESSQNTDKTRSSA